MDYQFKRDFYYDICIAFNKSNVIFLHGPRKCGKTVCLKQIDNDYPNAQYINFKTLSKEDGLKVFDTIKDAIDDQKDTIYLLDEITYAPDPEIQINKIADWLCDKETDVKIVITGSQSISLHAWQYRAFAGNAVNIEISFLTYNEWIRYKEYDEPSIDNYNEFLLTVHEFYNFTDLSEYLQGCLEETIISNYNTTNYVYKNECDLITEDNLLDICYAALFTLSNHSNVQTFFKNDKLKSLILSVFRDSVQNLGVHEIEKRIAGSFISKYEKIRTQDLSVIKQALLFLYNCGLISITIVKDSISPVKSVYQILYKDDIKTKEALFRNINICIKYPMFYIRILEDILQNEMPDKITGILLGNIVECHARGLLKEGMEYHDIEDKELDYINMDDQIGIEFTVSNKKLVQVNFDILPKGYSKLLLTKDRDDQIGDICQIPYYIFLYGFGIDRKRIKDDPQQPFDDIER